MGGDALAMAQVAGWLDGEGYFATTSNRSAEIMGDSIDPKPLWLCRAVLGGSVRPCGPRENPKYRQAWRWRVSGDTARAAARALLPYLLTKRTEAEAVALSWAHPADTPFGAYIRARAYASRTKEHAA